MRAPTPLPAHLRGRPFLVREALDAGVSPRRLRAGDLRAPHRQVRVEVAMEWDLVLRCRSALCILPPTAVFSGTTAVALLGLPSPLGADERPAGSGSPGGSGRPEAPVEVAVPSGVGRPRVDGVRVRQAPLPVAATVLRRSGLPVLAPADAWAERCGMVDDVEAVVLGDAVRRRASWGVMAASALALPGPAARDRALEVLFRVRSGVDSPMETRLRLVLVDAGLPEPACGCPVLDGGHEVLWPDLSWPEARVAVEHDGAHHGDAAQRRRDRARARLYRELGWEVVVVGDEDVLVRPAATVAHVGRVLRSRGLVW